MTSLKLCQLNIFLRPPPINSLGGEYKDVRMEHYARDFLEEYDIICLQECFGMGPRRAKLIELSKKHGFVSHEYSRLGCILGCDGLVLTDGGLMIMSKLPMTTSQFRAFSCACDVDKLARKGVLYARLKPNDSDKEIHVFTTHTQASYNFAANEASLGVKTKQLDEMAEFIKEMTDGYPKSWPIIVTGDFNMDSMQDKCPEYKLTVDHLESCVQTSENKFIDVFREFNDGKAIPTTTVFEWTTKNGLAIRSSMLTKDAKAYNDDHENAPDEQKVAGDVSHSTSYVSTGDTFWCDQCLDYIFVEQTPSGGVEVKSATIDPFTVEVGLPYTQISDHHALVIELELN